MSGGITVAAGGGTLSATQYTPTSGPVNNPLGNNTIKLAGGTLQPRGVGPHRLRDFNPDGLQFYAEYGGWRWSDVRE